MNTFSMKEQQLQKMNQPSDSEFNAVLDASVQSIFEASTVKQPGWQQGRELKAA